jgi:epoxyqueuosine reductase
MGVEMEMNQRLHEAAQTWGADFFGVADLSPARDAILAQGGPVLATYPWGISVGIVLMHAIVDQLPQRADRAVAIGYRQHSYDVINQRLDLLTSNLSSLLQREGHRALPVPAARRVDDERLCAAFSHKLTAHLAGLGWIGKSCLLVTPQVGPRVRWSTVLTDAPLAATGGPAEERCGACQKCVEICPAQAFTGQPFRAHEPRESRFDAGRCDRYFAGMKAVDPETAVCGLCLYVCPYGRR